MANYTANARTNYFRVKDIDALKADLRRFGINPATWDESSNGAEFVIDDASTNQPTDSIALFSFGPWPELDEDSVASRLELDGGEHDDTPVPDDFDSLHQLIAAHLVENEVAVFMEIGCEKMRYLGATAVAVNAAGETRRVDLEDIYGLAKELAPAGTSITLAVY